MDSDHGKVVTGFEISLFVFLAAFVIYTFFPNILSGSFEAVIFFLYQVFFAVLPFVAVIILGWAAFKVWVHYVQQDFISGIDFVLLEIVPPREVLRSPKAMELFFTNALYHWSNKGGREEFWQGAVWFWFSLEIVSLEGQVHFYVRTPTRVQSLVETQMYAQYPQAQVKVVEDYTLAVDEISPKSAWNAWGCELTLEKPEAYPIKTYVDFGLDKDPKEEYKVDPISPIVEFFGSLQKGEQAWMQIVVRPTKKKWKTAGTWFKTHDWVEEAKLEFFRLVKDYSAVKGKGQTLGTDSRIEIRVPPQMDTTVKAMNNKMTKLGFDTGIRIMYVAKKEAYSMNNRRNIRLIWRQFANPNSNALKRVNAVQGDAFGSSWLGISPEKVMVLGDRMLHEYRERGFFYLPMRHYFNDHNFTGFSLWLLKQFFLPYFHPPYFVLNVEELATLWHFPGQILKVPTLERIESKEAAPPTNLPI
jgi:hypothetical protein